jgi:hypothetical protein
MGKSVSVLFYSKPAFHRHTKANPLKIELQSSVSFIFLIVANKFRHFFYRITQFCCRTSPRRSFYSSNAQGDDYPVGWQH